MRDRGTNVSPPKLTLHSRCQVPEAQSAVPRARQGELAVGRDHDVTHEVRVSSQGALGHAVVRLIPGQLPHDDRFICNNEHIKKGRRVRQHALGYGDLTADRRVSQRAKQ